MLGTSAEQSHSTVSRSEGRLGQFSAPRRSRAKPPSARKRAVYVEAACVSCKSRKVRCDGGQPCTPCERRSFDCRYTKSNGQTPAGDSGKSNATPEGQVTQPNPSQVGLSELISIVTQLQRKIDALEKRESTTETTTKTTTEQHHEQSLVQDIDSPEHSIQSTTQAASPVFAGPTSADFSFRVADIILQRESGTEAGRPWVNAGLAASVSSDDDGDDTENLQLTAISSSLYGLQLQDALRLIQVYQESIDILHPLVNTDSLRRLATSIFANESNAPAPVATTMSAIVDIAHLKMAIAIALLAEGGGYSVVARKIYNDLVPIITKHILGRTFTLGGQILLLLTAFYHLFQDDSRLASRYVVIASRIMVEAGLHLKEIRRRYFPCDSEYARVLVVLTLSMYLDRQLNFNAGLPLSLKDTDIDIPEMETMPPYLKAMTSYMKIGPPAWAAVTDERGQLKGRINNEDYDFIQFQVQRWEENLPKELRIQRDRPVTDQIDPKTSPNRGRLLLRFILYLRANQFKIVIMRPLLFSTQTFSTNIEQVNHMTQLANDSIEMIVIANETYSLYATQQPLFNLFLSSALSTLLLIHVHLPSRGMVTNPDDLPEMDRTVQHGIEKGLRLLRSYSLSRSSQRLSKKIASLLQRLGFPVSETGNQPRGKEAHFYHTMEGCQSLVNSAQPPQDLLPLQDFSGWNNWFNIPSYDGLTSSVSFQYSGGDNSTLSSLGVPELNQMPFAQGTNQFNSDVLLSFMNDFSG